ncbi:hypothetical protein FOG48_00522 [Hanseniaspora uvarum]|nr:hypothetical protein FOG48_00522 [Hanseniaspora uvarum]
MVKQTTLKFFKFDVSQQVFFQSEHSFSIVNLKPITPHHILVIPKRHVENLYELKNEEKTDFFDTVHTLYRFIRYLTGTNGTNLAIQDGLISGQSVPHVHAHIIPRYEKGNMGDGVYNLLKGEYRTVVGKDIVKPDAPKERRERSMEEMIKEAIYLQTQLEKWLKLPEDEKDKQYVDIPDLDESSTEVE